MEICYLKALFKIIRNNDLDIIYSNMLDCDLNDKRYATKFYKKIYLTKKKVRPKLSSESRGWKKFNYAKTCNLSMENVTENIIRVDGNILSVDDFHEKYEKTNTPVIIINDQQNWPAIKKWKLANLKLKYRNQSFRCGDDENDRTVSIKMKYFADYMKNNNDDSPLYVFDGSLDENKKKARLLEDYQVSGYFTEDLFSILGDKIRPPFRWFVIGSARSGSNIHIDPLGTSAWNALVHGYKRWCLFPPCTPKFLVKPPINKNWGRLTEASDWFNIMYKRMLLSDWPSEYAMTEAIQKPGETIFVPSGWWHVVLNLTTTVAITQNFCSTINFPIVWRKTVKHRKKLSKLWYKKLLEIRPDLCEIADEINVNGSDENYYSYSSSSESDSSVSTSNPSRSTS